MTQDVVDAIDAVLGRAATAARTPEVAELLHETRRRLNGPLRLAIAGKVKMGKSTLLNALLGEELAPTDASECTKIVTWYRFGPGRAASVVMSDGSRRDPGWSRDSGALEVDLAGIPTEDIDRIEISWPSRRLENVIIVDTPGIASISTDISARTHRVLSGEDGRVPVTDAVLYLMRHVAAGDARFLEAFHDDELANGTPMNSVGVLSRADEVGSCTLHAMEAAERIADRYERDPRLRRLCPIIVPVDGLLGHAATTLTEVEYALLTRLAQIEPAAAEELLLTADRFADRTSPELTELERAHLLERFGLFGVRICVQVIRDGWVSSSAQLAGALEDISGLDRLRDVVARQFYQRSRILKARSAMSGLVQILRDDGCRDSAALLAEIERIEANDHSFEEVRLLGVIRSGTLAMSDDQLEELDQLLGGRGHAPAARLGLSTTSSPAAIRQAAMVTLTRWRRVAEHPLSSRPVQVAARTAVRTIESIIASHPTGRSQDPVR